MWVLGINWEWHDSSAVLVDGDGAIWSFSEEERFTGVKHAWQSFPTNAAQQCLAAANIRWQDLDVVAVGWDQPHNRRWFYPDRDRKNLLATLFDADATDRRRPEIVFVEHHLAHAMSSFYASGFTEAGVLVVDGSGEYYSTSIYAADHKHGLVPKRHWHRGYSLGGVYEAATRVLGFDVLDAGKTMGLAPYGNSQDSVILPLGDLIGETKPFFDIHPTAHYNRFTDAWMKYLSERFGSVTQQNDQLDRDPVATRLAASAQRTIEEAIRALYTETVCLTGSQQICLAGGVALNCVANGRLPDPVYVPPFPHDAGVALGAAWSVCPPTNPQLLESTGHGVDPRPGKELDELRDQGFDVTDLSIEPVIDLLLQERIGAIVEGGAEVGPRALGHRSIIALPRHQKTRDTINTLKGREPWRPLAPVTLPDYAPRLWPSQGLRELYMVGNTTVSSHAREVMPAAIHVDGTTRPQVLRTGQAPLLEALLTSLGRAGLPPVLVNTSFNGRGQPIVNSAEHAVRSFQELKLDFLVLGDHLIRPSAKQSDGDLP
jgi:carbamoyltransferase